MKVLFTGIIEEVGTVKELRMTGNHARLTVSCSKVLGGMPTADEPLRQPTRIGDSIATSGICLTVTALTGSTFSADVMPETVNRTAFSVLRPGSKVNLERAMPAYGRFGGHIVSGHIDGTGTILSLRPDGNAVWFRISASDELMRYIVTKGSITIDGISLTVADSKHTKGSGEFSVSIIPHTLAETALSTKKAGDPVNLETDMIGKYVERLLADGPAETGRNKAGAAASSDSRLEELLKAF